MTYLSRRQSAKGGEALQEKQTFTKNLHIRTKSGNFISTPVYEIPSDAIFTDIPFTAIWPSFQTQKLSRFQSQKGSLSCVETVIKPGTNQRVKIAEPLS